MMVDQVEEAGGKGRPGHCTILQTKTNPIIEDYTISSNVLGLGINGKVVECFSKKDNTKYALKVSLHGDPNLSQTGGQAWEA